MSQLPLGPAPIRVEGGGRRSPWTPIIYILLVIFGVTTVFPFLWVVGAAFKPTDEITSRPLQLLPNPARWRLSSRFKAGDVLDWPAFCRRLVDQQESGRPAPGARIWPHLPAADRALVEQCAAGRPLNDAQKAQVLGGLNEVLKAPDLYEEQAFAEVAVPDEAQDMMVRAERVGGLSRRSQARLNRLLIQAAYPQLVREAIGPFDNFRKALSMVPFARFFINSLFVAAVVTLGQVATSACAAYAFARLRFPGRDRIFLGYLGTMMVPWTVVMIPTFVMLKAFGWIDTFWALTLPAMFSAYGTFMLRQFFLGIPKEYEEAAKIDGCGYFGTFWHVIMPLSKPALATLALFTFIGSWNNLIGPLVFIISEDKMTLPLGLTSFQGLRNTDWGPLMAGSLMMLVPMIVLFAVGQRFFTRGIRLTAGKG
jgi:multiple sugar transport system permease protein